MIKEDTVFILGAGASCPYGYPTGVELRNLIYTSGIEVIKKIVKTKLKSRRELYRMHTYELGKIIEHSNSDDQIDWIIKKFESSKPYLANIGKMLITHFILTSEKESITEEGTLKSNPEQDWYQELFSTMTKPAPSYDASPELFKRNLVTFFTFNYDRSVDYFFKTKIESYYDFKYYGSHPKHIYSQFKPFHIYGVISNLYKDDCLHFGNYQNELSVLEKHKDDINLIRTGYDTLNTIDIQETISEANRIYFLGFGYDERNLQLLGFPKILNDRHEIFGTAYEKTQGEIDRIKKSIAGNKSIKTIKRFEIKSFDCLRLLREYPPT